MTGAQALIESLKQEQVTHIFGYAGATICSVVDALKQTTGIGYTLVRTEQNAGHMASGYSRVNGKVGVCMVTSGPGATNLITGIATAYMDSIPMVAITGQVPSHLLGRDIFQEVDITGAVAPFSKHSYLVKDANQIPNIIKEAFHIASTGRPGPVLIDIPMDIQTQELAHEFHYPTDVTIRGYRPSVRGNDMQIRRVADAITTAKHPVICAGGGVFLSNAQQELRQLVEHAGIPVVTTMMGLSLFPTDHPLNMGMVGAHGNNSANNALSKSDLLIMVGSRAADRSIVSPESIANRMLTIHIDVDPAEIGKNMHTDIPIVGDVKVILQQLLALSPRAEVDQWITEMQTLRRVDLTRIFPTREASIFPPTALRKLGARLDKNAAVCVDVGQNQLHTCKHLPLKDGVRLLTSGGLGTMGYSLPAGIGVKIADTNRQTIVICGDGSFQMSMNELSAISAANLDVKIIVFQNNTLGLVNQIQNSAYSGSFGVDLDGSPDFQIIASAYGIPSADICDEADLDATLDTMLSTKGSFLLICRVHPDVTTND